MKHLLVYPNFSPYKLNEELSLNEEFIQKELEEASDLNKNFINKLI